MSKKVALLVGGWSAERLVSLAKGKSVEKALVCAGYDVSVVDVTKDIEAFVSALTPRPDVVFNNLHGRGGEDGVIQGVLEMVGLPYTHSSVMASAIAMNKPMANHIVAAAGINVPEGHIVTKEQIAKKDLPLKAPYVLKPANEGSSVDVHIVLHEGHNHPLPEADTMLQERYIPGKELTVGVLDGKAQAVTEIKPRMDFFDYAAKYEDMDTAYDLPARIDKNVYEKAMRWSEKIFELIGASGFARCDFRYDESKGENGLYFLEINTQPGFTPESIGPSQALYNGMSFEDLCAHLVEHATCHG